MKFTLECPKCMDERLQRGAEAPPDDERSTTFTGTVDNMKCPKCGFVFGLSDVLEATGTGAEDAKEIEKGLERELAEIARKAKRKPPKGR